MPLPDQRGIHLPGQATRLCQPHLLPLAGHSGLAVQQSLDNALKRGYQKSENDRQRNPASSVAPVACPTLRPCLRSCNSGDTATEPP